MNEKLEKPNMEGCELQEKEEIKAEADSQEKSSETTALEDILQAAGLSFKPRKKKKLLPPAEQPIENESAEANVVISEDIPTKTLDEYALDEADATVPESFNDVEDFQPAPSTNRLQFNRHTIIRIFVMIVVSVGAFAAVKYVPILMEPRPPSPDVVATYNDKSITTAELMDFVRLEGYRESEHGVCEVHGFDHSKCDAFEECETHPIHSMEAYRQIIEMIAVQKMIVDWADETGVTQREDVTHGLKDLVESANLDSLINQLHEEQITPESIPKWEVQQYYDENKDQYGGSALSDVEAEIRNILVEQKDADFFPSYIEELKKTAGLEVNFNILNVAAPTDEQIKAYYQANLEQYTKTASAEGLEIRIEAGTGGTDISSLAQEAHRKLQSGDNFEQVAGEYAKGGAADKVTIEKGSGNPVYEEQAWRLEPGQFSPAFEDAGSMVIFKLISKTDGGQQALQDVSADIRQILFQQNMDQEYELRKDEALFSVHGRRYTLGEFYVEFQELPAEYQAYFSTITEKKSLVEQMIAKELLLEEYGDEGASAEDQHRIDDLKQQYLSQIYHQENVDAHIEEITDEEAIAFYEENKERLISPPSVKVSLIYIPQGSGESEQQKNRTLANEALQSARDGADFGDVAKQYSQDGTAKNGGVLEEWLHEEYLSPELSIPIFSAKVGDMTNVIEYHGGYYIFKINERMEERQQSYEELADAIKNHLKDEKHIEMEADLERQMLEDSNLTVYDRTIRGLLKENTK